MMEGSLPMMSAINPEAREKTAAFKAEREERISRRVLVKVGERRYVLPSVAPWSRGEKRGREGQEGGKEGKGREKGRRGRGKEGGMNKKITRAPDPRMPKQRRQYSPLPLPP